MSRLSPLASAARGVRELRRACAGMNADDVKLARLSENARAAGLTTSQWLGRAIAYLDKHASTREAATARRLLRRLEHGAD